MINSATRCTPATGRAYWSVQPSKLRELGSVSPARAAS